MKILHVNSYYYGGKFYKNLFDRQVNKGLDIDVFVPIAKGVQVQESILGDYTLQSVNHSKYDRLIFHIKHKKILNDIINKYNIKDYSLVHAHSLFSNGYIAMKLKERFTVPYIVSVRNTDVNIFFKYMFHLRKLGIKILKEADKIIFLSEPYKKQVIETYVPYKLRKQIEYKAEVIPNGIDDFWFENKGIAKQLEKNNTLKLLYVGVINRNKNVTTTIKAVEILLSKGYNITYTIVGRVKDENIYKKIKNYSFVNYIPHLNKEELLKVYREHDIFIMPSLTETFGLVYAEAMSQGLPVIYSKGQGFDGQFEDGVVGYSVESTNPTDIVDKVHKIINDYSNISKRCIEHIEQFSWDKISKVYLSHYSKIR